MLAHLLILDFERGQSGLQLLVPEHELCLHRLLGADLTHLVGGIRNRSYNRAVEPASRGTGFLLRCCVSHTDPLKIPTASLLLIAASKLQC